MPIVLMNGHGWGATPIRRKRPHYARNFLYEIRFPGRPIQEISAEIERIQRNVHCMIKRETLFPKFNLDTFTVFVKNEDELLAVRMATTITDVAIYRLHTPVPRQAPAAD
jgi:hypothetical protein